MADNAKVGVDRTIEDWGFLFGGMSGEEKEATGATPGFGSVEVASIAVEVECHVAGEEADYCTEMGGQIVKEVVAGLQCFFGVLALVARDVTEANTKGCLLYTSDAADE